MTSQNLWALIHSNRLGWAERARLAFAEAMPSVFRQPILDLGDRSDIPVAVYGPSQVGKTSLILRLMGIRPEAEAEVGTVLRGGTQTGQAATATLMIYRRSPDAHYRLFRPDCTSGEVLDGASLEAALGMIRATVESKKIPKAWLEAPFRVEIPSDYFSSSSGSSVQILDLPGDRSANREERNHVETLIQKYSALATSVLLVTASHRLRCLDDPGRKALQGWYRQSHRCRLIITFALSAKSTWKEMPPEGASSTEILERLRSIYWQQFSKDLDEKKVDPNLKIYPMEYGESWRRATMTDPTFAARFGHAMDAQMEALRADLGRMASPHNRILSILDGESILQRELEEMDIAAESLHAEEDRCRKALGDARAQEREWKKRCETTRAKIVSEKLPEITFTEPPFESPKDVPGFKLAIKNIHANLIVSTDKALKPFEDEIGVIKCIEEKRILLELAEQWTMTLFKKIQSYKINTYHTWISDNFDRDTEYLKKIQREMPIKASDQISKWVQNVRKDFNKPIKILLRKYEKTLKRVKKFANSAKNKYYLSKIQHEKYNRDYSAKKHELEKAIGEFLIFHLKLDQEFLIERNTIILEMNRPDASPAFRFFYFMKLHQIHKERMLFRSASEAQK